MGEQKRVDRSLDCVGLYCPEPVFRTRQELDQMEVGDVLEVVADDPASEEDIPRLVKRLEQQLVEMHKDKDQIHFMIKKIK